MFFNYLKKKQKIIYCHMKDIQIKDTYSVKFIYK